MPEPESSTPAVVGPPADLRLVPPNRALRTSAARARAAARAEREAAERTRAASAGMRAGRADGATGVLRQRLATATDTADNLRRALESNRRIGIAVGVLMTRLQLTEDQAFDLLRAESQRRNEKLRVVAEEVVLTGELGARTPAGKRKRPRSAI